MKLNVGLVSITNVIFIVFIFLWQENVLTFDPKVLLNNLLPLIR